MRKMELLHQLSVSKTINSEHMKGNDKYTARQLYALLLDKWQIAWVGCQNIAKIETV